jgi:tripeptide aminopeptidase
MKKFLYLFVALSLLCSQTFASAIKEKNMYSMIKQDRLVDSFIRYAKIDTGSNPNLAEIHIPSTDKQFTLANLLCDELKNLGLKDVKVDEHCFVTATLPANIDNAPIVALFAHIDTAHDVLSGPVSPQIFDYKGGDLNIGNGIQIPKEDLFSEVGHHVITTDGKSLLGADDKAGVAEIMETLYVLSENPSIKHPELKIVFSPDEETGMGISSFDAEHFIADVAYTVDGGAPFELDTETFNAFNPEIIIKGKVVHCGYAYKKMVSAIEIANEFMSKLPKNQTPSTTKDKQGYFFIDEVSGNAETTTIKMLVRDFDLKKAEERVSFLEKTLKKLEKEHKGCEITFNPKPCYQNMKEYLKKFPEVVLYAEEAIKRTGYVPVQNSVRGGTDGSQLTVRGLLTPNLGAGGINFHSQREFVSAETMAKCCENILNLVEIWAEKSSEIMPEIQKNGRRNNIN